MQSDEKYPGYTGVHRKGGSTSPLLANLYFTGLIGHVNPKRDRRSGQKRRSLGMRTILSYYAGKSPRGWSAL